MKRKFVAFLLSSVFMVPQFAYATTEQVVQKDTKATAVTDLPAKLPATKSASLEQAILKVKSQLTIPDKLSKFTYTEEDEVYQFHWNDKEDKEFINVSSTLEGDILNYYASNDTNTYSSVAVADYSKAQQTAQAFLNQVAASYVDKLQLKENNIPSRSSEYVFIYELVHDSIKVYHQEVEVRVNKQTGKVTSFQGLRYHANAQFEDKTPTLSLEDAKKAYIEKLGLDLKYNTYYDEETKKEQSFLAYNIEKENSKGISAKTGEVIEGKDTDRIWYEEATSDAGGINKAENSAANQLTDEEQKEVLQRENLLDAEEALAKVKAYFPLLNDMEITNTYLSQDREQTYTRQVSLEKKNKEDVIESGAWFNVDAVTGEVWSYSYYNDEGYQKVIDDQKQWTEAEAKTFLQKVDPEAAKTVQYVPQKDNNSYNKNRYQFERLVNGIPVASDMIEMRYEPSIEQVESYYKYWTDAEFKAPHNTLTKEQAADKIGLELVYMQVEDDKYMLAYNHDEQNFFIDAYSGKKVDYMGKEVEKTEAHVYTDIQGHKYEQEIKNLYYSGIYLKDEALKPDNAITKKEFVELIKQAKPYDDMQESIDTILGTVSDTQTLTKEQGIACLLAVSPYKKVADATDIFNYPYESEPTNASYKGSITLAYGLDWLPKETIDPKTNLTKAEAMLYLYHALEDIRG